MSDKEADKLLIAFFGFLCVVAWSIAFWCAPGWAKFAMVGYGINAFVSQLYEDSKPRRTDTDSV